MATWPLVRTRAGTTAFLLLAGFSANALLALILARRSVPLAVLVALVPAIMLLLGRLAAGSGAGLVCAAVMLPISFHPLNVSYHFGVEIYPSDFLVALSIGVLLAGQLRDIKERPRWPELATVRLGLVCFAVPMAVGALRGHAAYGVSFLGQPARLFAYAAIGIGLTRLSPDDARRALTKIYYAGTIWMLLNGAFYLATGTSQTDQTNLSTGGTRYLSGSVAASLAYALLLALLNLSQSETARARVLHATFAVLALVGVVLAETRAVFVGLAAALLVLALIGRGLARRALSIVPILAPFIVVGTIALMAAVPQLLPTFGSRIAASPSTDANAIWRVRANEAVSQDIHASPIDGVGFGKSHQFSWGWTDPQTGLVYSQEEEIGQDPHDGYVYLLAGGGILALLGYLAVLGAYGYEFLRRFPGSTGNARLLLLWSLVSLLVFLVAVSSGPILSGTPSDMLVSWVFLTLPAVAPVTARRRAAL